MTMSMTIYTDKCANKLSSGVQKTSRLKRKNFFETHQNCKH